MTVISRNKVIVQGDVDMASPLSRITNLENNEYKVTYYEIISGASGSITVPTGATINAGEFGLSGNCILSKIDGSNKPTFESPKTSGGTIVTASLNTSTGAWVASGTYVSASVALIYSIKIKAVYYSNLTYSNIIETMSGVQSIIGASVDNTDPLNPIINPLGLVQITDKAGDFFTDLATANAYISTFTNATITNESYNNGVYYFTVPSGSDFSDTNFFLSLGAFATTDAYIVDTVGLITVFSDSLCLKNNGNNVFGNITCAGDSFTESGGINTFKNISADTPSFVSSTGRFIFNGSVTATGIYLSDFFLTSTATISTIASNYGNTDLIQATTNGANVQYDGINLATVNDIVAVDINTIGVAINGATSATPNDTDLVMSVDTSVAKKSTWTQIKAFLKTYFDTIYLTAGGWIDISSVVTAVGFSSSTILCWYKITNGNAFVYYNITGTSNATNFQIADFPFTANSNQPTNYVAISVTNNGTASTTSGRVRMDASDNKLIFQRDQSGATWTNIGTKASAGQIMIML